MIELKNIVKSYNGRVNAVDNLSLKINAGQIFGFLGHNGAGKTTTIKMITGIIEPDSGEILINNINICKEPLKAKMDFAFVSDSPDAFLRLKGIEYLNFIGDMYNVPMDRKLERIMKLSKEFELEHALLDKIQSYSHGMRQKIFIVGALIHDPKVLILDEPLTGLDPKAASILKNIMREHANKGNTVFFSTHVLEVAEKLCDEVAILNKGKLVYSGSLKDKIKELGESASLENVFLEMVYNEETN
ncbi:MAG: ABC transporter ATP-binding protein [Bacillota bacterium]|nr:ABC transporter ATP-binding protein [Bacillota bacterium]